MALTLTEKILSEHLTDGALKQGAEIGIKIDQTLTQDATGTMAYLQFESMGIPRVKTEKSVAYIDHNTLQSGFENADDHRYIASVAKKHGVWFSRAGNGICHQVHLERFGIPGKTLLGSDSHTPTGGGLGMLAFGAGGLDVAVAMGGGAYYITCPEIIKVNLVGRLTDWVSAKDVILEVLRLLTVKGGVGKVIEYAGEGVKTLSVPERATITNMGAELGATTSVFPSDEETRKFLKAQGRETDYRELAADDGAVYASEITVDLSALKPLAACPHSPDNVKPVQDLKGLEIQQVCIGSCTNSSLSDMMKVAFILKDKTVSENVSLSVAPGSKQVFTELARHSDVLGGSALEIMIAAGARILESACGPCIGMGQSPSSGGVSLRTFNRNFQGRSGTKDAQVYLVSPETAAVSALTGVLTDPKEYLCSQKYVVPVFEIPELFTINDNMIAAPADEETAKTLQIVRGPNIKPFPGGTPVPPEISGKVLLKVGDNITTDHIMPAGAKILPLRSNVPAISEYCFSAIDETFPARAKAAVDGSPAGSGIIVGGANYGQGSSREHAALAPLFLGIKAVICKSFARIHKQNLINNGIMPLTFRSESDYDRINDGDDVRIITHSAGEGEIMLIDRTAGFSALLVLDVSERNRKILMAGGLLNIK